MTEIVRVTDEQRRDKLAQAINYETFRGWSIASRSDYDAVMTRKNKINHGLHLAGVLVFLLLFLPISFIWGVVWALLPLFRRTKMLTIRADENGVLSRHETVRG